MNRSWLAAVPLVIAISFVILSATQSSKRSERSDRGAQPSADTGVGDRARDPKESGALERAREASDDAAGQATIQAVDGVTGRPIAGATVLIHVPGSTEEIRMRSDANGRCTFACDENTTGVVCAPGYAIKHWERYGRGPAELRLKPASEVTLTVIDEDGQVPPGATAQVERFPTTRASADLTGRIRLKAADRLEVSAPGFAPRFVPAKDATVLLERGFVAEGRVYDSAGMPLAGCRITIRHGGFPEEHLARVVTDAAGRFEASGLSSGYLAIDVTKHGYAPGSIFPAHPGDTHLEGRLFRSASIRVEIIGHDGDPVTERVLSYDVRSKSNRWYENRGSCASGLLIEDLPPGEFLVSILGDTQQAERTVTVSEGEVKSIRLALEDPKQSNYGSYAHVRVLHSNGQPIEGAKVDSVVTDENGIARLHWDERYTSARVHIDPPKRLVREACGVEAYIRTQAARHVTKPVVITLPKPALLELDVVDVAGRPVELESARALDEHAHEIGAARWLVHPGMKTSVELTTLGGSLWMQSAKEFWPGRHRVVMHAPRSITGRLLDEHGQPVVGSDTVMIDGQPLRWTDRDGRFRFRTLAAGKHTVVAKRGVIPEARVQFELSLERDLDLGEIVLRKPKRVRGRVIDHHGKRIGGATIWALVSQRDWWSWQSETASHADGSFSLLVESMARHIVIAKRGYGTQVVRIEGLGEIRLPPPGRLEIEGPMRRYRRGWPQPDGTIVWMGWVEPWPHVSDSNHETAPGRRVVEIHTLNGDIQRHDVTIVAGKTTRVRAE